MMRQRKPTNLPAQPDAPSVMWRQSRQSFCLVDIQKERGDQKFDSPFLLCSETGYAKPKNLDDLTGRVKRFIQYFQMSTHILHKNCQVILRFLYYFSWQSITSRGIRNLMLKRTINIFISFSLVLLLFSGATVFPQAVRNNSASFQKPCNMDDCNPGMPKCPLCPSSSSINLYLHQETGAYLPILTSSLIFICVDTLSDQGFVKSIFRPPTSLS